MPSAEIITVGTELLLGQLVDTNTQTIAAALAETGIDVYRQSSVGDNEARLAQAVAEALERSDVVICAGGLGPTVDDVTREAIARATGRELELNQAALHDLQAWFAKLNRTMSDNNKRQATFPHAASVLANPNGTAPGFALEHDGKLVIALPGPPRELAPMLHDRVLPLLQRRFALRSTLVTRVLRTVGMSESEIDRRIEDLFRSSANPSIAVLAHLGEVDIKLTAKAESKNAALALIERLEPVVRERIGDHIFSSDGQTLPEVLGARLRARGWSIATGESCTGGLIGAMITSVPGSSDYYAGGVIAYSNQAKTDLLDVAPELIERHGAVSEEVAVAMAIGAQAAFRSSLALSITGVAGPGGGSHDKPVGLVYIGLASRSGEVEVQRRHIPGGREAVGHRAALAALMMAWRLARQ